MEEKQEIFNPAFQDLKKIIKRSQEITKRVTTKEQDIINEVIPDDNQIFNESMADVSPLPDNKREKKPNQGRNKRPSHPLPDEDQEVIDHLRDLVGGSVDMDITFSDEYIEGSISGVTKKMMRRLKRGRLPVQDHIDLHGLTKKEAEAAVKNFLLKSHKRGLRCVLIVHGRGLNSPDSFPVLKERLPVWLNRGPARKIVMAFSTARPYDGGTGAIYVLLRGR